MRKIVPTDVKSTTANVKQQQIKELVAISYKLL